LASIAARLQSLAKLRADRRPLDAPDPAIGALGPATLRRFPCGPRCAAQRAQQPAGGPGRERHHGALRVSRGRQARAYRVPADPDGRGAWPAVHGDDRMGRQVAGRWDLAIDAAVEVDGSEVFGRADRRAWHAGEARGHRDGHRFPVCRISAATAAPEISDNTATSLIAHTSPNVSAMAPADNAPIAWSRQKR